MMRIKKMDKIKAVNKIINYIKENTINGNFMPLRTMEAAKILNMGNTFSVEVLNIVKLFPCIQYQKVIVAKGNAPYEFRYVEIKNFEITKFNNVSKEEQSHIEDVLKSKGFSSQLIINTLCIYNTFLQIFEEHDGSYPEKDLLKNASALLLVNEKELDRYFKLLIELECLSPDEDKKKEEAALDETSSKEDSEEVLNNTERQQEIKIEDVLSEEVRKELETVGQMLKDENQVEEQNNQIYGALLENLVDFRGFMENFQNFFGETVKDIVKPEDNSKEVERLQKEAADLKFEVENLKVELEKGVPVLEKYQHEFKRMNENLMNKEETVKRQKLINKALEERNDLLINTMQERLAIMLAEMTNSVTEYVQLPKWKLNPSITAKFQNGLTKTVTSAIEDIIHSNDNISKDE